MPQPYSTNASGAIFLPGYGWISQQDYMSLGIEPFSLGSPAPAAPSASPGFAGNPSGAGLAPGMMFPNYTPRMDIPLVPPPGLPDIPSTTASGGDTGAGPFDFPGFVDQNLGSPSDEGQPAQAQGPPVARGYPAPPTPGGAGVPLPPPPIPNIPQERGPDLGGWGQAAGFFGVRPQNPIGVFGVGGPTMPAGGGSYFGGRSNPAMWLPGSTFNIGAGGGGTLTSPYQNWIGTRSPAYLKWMAARGIGRHEATRLFAGSGGPAAVSGAIEGALHSGQKISPA